MNNCVAINIIADNKILNKNGVPILFYWDGKSNVIDEIKGQKVFMDFIKSKTLTVENYAYSAMTYFCFTEDENNNWEEKYNEKVIYMQDLFPLSEQSDDELAMSYVLNINIDLYNKVFASEYKKVSSSNKANVKGIYDNIKSKYGTRVTPVTYVEYIRSELVKNYGKLSKENLNYIIDKLKKTIKL